jgi:hypothetical protein
MMPEIVRMSRRIINEGSGMHQVKPGIWINLDAVVSANCIHEPEETQDSQDGTSPERNQAKRYVLTLTLCDGSTLTFTELKELVALCKLLGISKPKTWPAHTVRA